VVVNWYALITISLAAATFSTRSSMKITWLGGRATRSRSLQKSSADGLTARSSKDRPNAATRTDGENREGWPERRSAAAR